jgi:serine/threonine protein kinase
MLEITQCIDKYVLSEQLGRGSAAEVWKAFDTILQRDVAIKFLHPARQLQPSSVKRFQREARAIASLQHPNIIQIYDTSSYSISIAGSAEGSIPYLVMQYVQGPTLAEYIAQTSRSSKFPSAVEILEIFSALTSAVDYAHKQGMIHRDIKPTNILLDQQNTPALPGNPILTDFGLVKLQEDAFDSWQSYNTILGTPLYISPEQAQGFAATHLSDLYSLGVILYELCTGKLPFDFTEHMGDQHPVASLMQQILYDPIPPSFVHPNISPELESVILKSIAKEPVDRFSNAQSMYQALEQVLVSPSLDTRSQDDAVYDPLPLPEIEEHRTNSAYLRRTLPKRQSLHATRHKGRHNIRRNVRQYQQQVQESVPPQRFKVSPSTLKFVPVILILVFLIGLIPLLLMGGSSSTLRRKSPPAGSITFGHVSFLSSGQGNAITGMGINDEVEVELTQLTTSAPGKAYYAWLLPDSNRSNNTAPILLGKLIATQGIAHLLYKEPQHTNLLMNMSRFLITEEDTGGQPSSPSLDKTTWRAVGAISDAPNPTDQNHYSTLSHIRHLLAADPQLEAVGLQGGLSLWFNRNVNLVQNLAQNAQDSYTSGDTIKLHNQLINLLGYLDGTQDLAKDVPESNPALTDVMSMGVGLVQIHAYQNPSSYLYHIGIHLSSLSTSTGVTTDQQRTIRDIITALGGVQRLLEEVRTISKQVIALSSTQLSQPEVKSQLATLVQLTTMAYNGQDQEQQHGVKWIYQQLLSLAAISVTR